MKKQAIIAGRREPGKRQSRFQQLWQQAVNDAAEIDALEFTLDELVVRVETDVVPVERTLGVVVQQALERQLDFSTRKTLKKWQRVELEKRIAELVADLVCMDMLDPELHERIALRQMAARGLEPDLDSDLSIAKQLDVVLAAEFSDRVDPWWDIAEPRGGRLSAGPACLDDSVFKHLFRQTAAALHPDKESDHDRLAEKHELMVQLLRAREERDLVTLLRLHERYAACQSELSNAEEAQLESVLMQHLEVLQDRRESVIWKSRQHFMTFRRFHHKDPVATDELISCHLQVLAGRKVTLDHFLSKVRTLKALQEFLSQPDSLNWPGRHFFT